MRILMVSNYFPEHVGGIETIADNLARGYRDDGHVVRWLAADARVPHRGHPDDVALRCWNVTEQRLGFPYPILAPSAYRVIWQEAKACDVIHLHDCLYLASVATALAGRCHHKPIVLTQHIAPVPYRHRVLQGLQWLAYRTLGRLVLLSAAQTVFYSDSVVAWFEKHLKLSAPPEIIRNGVDTSIFRPVTGEARRALRRQLGLIGEAPVLLFSARFVRKKGLHLLQEVAAREPGWRWVLIGRPGDVDPRAWGLNNVQVLEAMPQRQLAQYYAVADLLILPSTGEGFPAAVQEAMSCGTPALVSERVRGDAQGAPIFASGLSSQAVHTSITQALATVDREPELRARVAQFARRHWDWQVAVSRYETILGTLVDKRTGSPRRRVA